LAKSTPILINFFTDGLPLCGAPATTPWHYDAVEERPSTSSCELHSKGRRHIPRQRHRVTNWREYDASLRNRGSLTIWFTPEAIAGWKAQPRTTPGGQRHYSDLAIETALTLRTVFRLALRQSEGLTEGDERMPMLVPKK
jgi:hypothetical protein